MLEGKNIAREKTTIEVIAAIEEAWEKAAKKQKLSKDAVAARKDALKRLKGSKMPLGELDLIYAEGIIEPGEYDSYRTKLENARMPMQPELEKIREKLKAGIEQLVVHGDYKYDVDGKVTLLMKPDLDALGGVYLLNLAGIDYRMVTFVHKGETIPGAFHIDTGPYEKPTITDDGSVYYSGHGKEKTEKPTSATQMIYETLVEGGLLQKEEWLDRFSSFVTEIDNLSYPLDKEFFKKDWWRTIYGTYKALPVHVVANYFKEGGEARKPFGLAYRGKTIVRETEKGKQTLENICQKTRQLAMQSLAHIDRAADRMKAAGIPAETPELGKVIINAIGAGRKNRIPMGATAVRAAGYDTYILWSEEHKSFFINPKENVERVYERIAAVVPEATLIRGTMILLTPTKGKESGVTFDTLLTALQFANYNKEKLMEGPSSKESGASAQGKELEELNLKLAKGEIGQDVYDELHKKILEGAKTEEKKTSQQKIEEMQSKLDLLKAEGKISDEQYESRSKLFKRLKAASNPYTELDLIKAEGELSDEEYDVLHKSLEKEIEIKPAPELEPVLAPGSELVPAPAKEKTPEELEKEAREKQTSEMAYRLKTGNLNGNLQEFQQKSQENPRENPVPSEELKTVTDWWTQGQNILLKAYEDKERFTRDITKLKKEIAELQKGNNAGTIAAKEGELQMLENKLTALAIGTKEAKLKELQERLKAELINEFRKDKGAFMLANKDEFVALYKRKHGIPENTVFTLAQEERALKELLNEKLIQRSSRVIAESIKYHDDNLAQERMRRTAELQEKSNIQKWIESWQKMPTWKRLALGAGVAGAVGSGVAMYFGATLLGAVVTAGTYRAARSLVGAGGGMVLNSIAQKIAGGWFGKERGKLREQRISSISGRLKEDVQASVDFLESEAGRIKWAKIIDDFVDAQREAEERLNKKEKKQRWLLAGLYGALGGLSAGLALDYTTGGQLPSPTKSAKNWWDKFWGKGEEVPPVVGKGAVPPPAGRGGVPPPGIPLAPDLQNIYPELDHPLAGPGTGPKFGVIDQAPPGARIESVESIGKRGIWGAVEEQLKKYLEAKGRIKWGDLNEAQKTWLTDYFKDKVVENPADFGVADPDHPPARIDFKDLFGGDSVDKALLRARGLSPADMESIVKNNADIREWVKNNPGKPLTMAQADEIIRSKATGASSGAGVDAATSRPSMKPVPEAPAEGYKAGTPDTTGGTPKATPAEPTKPTASAEAAGAAQGGGRVLNVGPDTAPATGGAGGTPKVSVGPEPGATRGGAETIFGSAVEQTVADKIGFQPEEYKFLKEVTVDKLLKEIPEGKWSTERAQMWRNFSGGRSWPDLPHTKSFLEGISGYKSSELLKQADLADAIYKLNPGDSARGLTIAEFIKQYGSQLEIENRLL